MWYRVVMTGQSLVACGYDDEGGLKLLSPSLELVQTLVGHDGRVECVTVSPSGSHLASGDWGGKVMIWSEPGKVASGRECKCLRITRV